VGKRKATVDNPWDDSDFVELHAADVAAESRGELDEGLSAEEFAARYADYLPGR
jgi:hypothetical protein